MDTDTLLGNCKMTETPNNTIHKSYYKWRLKCKKKTFCYSTEEGREMEYFLVACGPEIFFPPTPCQMMLGATRRASQEIGIHGEASLFKRPYDKEEANSIHIKWKN